MACFNVVGAQVGTRLAISGGTTLMRRVFIAVVTALILKNGWDAIARL